MKKKRARSQPVPGRTAPAPATGDRVQVGDVVYLSLIHILFRPMRFDFQATT